MITCCCPCVTADKCLAVHKRVLIHLNISSVAKVDTGIAIDKHIAGTNSPSGDFKIKSRTIGINIIFPLVNLAICNIFYPVIDEHTIHITYIIPDADGIFLIWEVVLASPDPNPNGILETHLEAVVHQRADASVVLQTEAK